MDEKNDETVLRRRMRKVRIDEFKREISGKPIDPPDTSAAPETSGPGLIRSFAIVLTMLAVVVAVMLAVLPPS